MPASANAPVFPSAPAGPRRRWTWPLVAGLLLAGFYGLLLASLGGKGATYDETTHALGGYVYWKYNDYRLNPENGNLPQRLAALPLLAAGMRPPDTTGPAWAEADQWALADPWFYDPGHDHRRLLFLGRAAAGLAAVALGLLVWLWSRRLFGPWGGLVSLLLYVLSPAFLANGGLMTSDTLAALGLLGGTAAIGALLHRLTPGRVVLAGLVSGALLATKMSAGLLVPVWLVLVAARLIGGRPLPAGWRGRRVLVRRGSMATVLLAAGLVQAAIAVAVLWAVFGFRFSSSPGRLPGESRQISPWEYVLDRPTPGQLLLRAHLQGTQLERADAILDAHGAAPGLWDYSAVAAMAEIERTVLTPAQARTIEVGRSGPPAAGVPRVVDFLRQRRWLPEAYLYGVAHFWRSSRWRAAFLNGECRATGWWYFFPYTFLVKTPLPVFGVLLLAFAARGWSRWSGGGGPDGGVAPGSWELLPLGALLGVYGVAVLASRLDIGHRHLLALYPPLFILAGAAGGWLAAAFRAGAGRAARTGGVLVVGLLALHGADTLYQVPDYIASFNVLAGGPSGSWRHLVDSSLDWGQDLPGVARWLERERPAGSVYLAYFGNDRPAAEGVRARPLFTASGRRTGPEPALRLLDLPPTADPAAAAAELARTSPDGEVLGSADFGSRNVLVWIQKPDMLRLSGGTYLVSASLLQPIQYDLEGPWGPWNRRFEDLYGQLARMAAPLLADNPAERRAALEAHPLAQWREVLTRYETFRFARLTAWLRQRQPDDQIGHSILVYRLSDAEIAQALEGPPAELGADRALEVQAELESAVARVR